MREMVSSVDASLRSRSAVSRSMSLFRIPHSASRTSDRGFTLIELAIVLVIIGIIIGAVLKGQDLIVNARAKKFINWEKSWEVAQWQFFDRMGRFAGDEGKNGIIGDNNAGAGTETTLTKSALDEILNANFINPPAQSISLGASTFYTMMGYGTVTSVNRNAIVLCKTSPFNVVAPCATVLTTDELVYFQSLDTALDGSADPLVGNVRGITAATGVAGTTYPAITAITETAATTWDTTTTGLVYYFDKPR